MIRRCLCSSHLVCHARKRIACKQVAFPAPYSVQAPLSCRVKVLVPSARPMGCATVTPPVRKGSLCVGISSFSTIIHSNESVKSRNSITPIETCSTFVVHQEGKGPGRIGYSVLIKLPRARTSVTARGTIVSEAVSLSSGIEKSVVSKNRPSALLYVKSGCPGR